MEGSGNALNACKTDSHDCESVRLVFIVALPPMCWIDPEAQTKMWFMYGQR